MRLVADSTKDYAIMTLDIDGNVTSWNKGAERIFGFTEEEIHGKPGAVIFLPEDREKGVPEDEMGRALRDGRAEDERWHIRKDGTRFYCSGVMTPLTNGKLYGYAKIARDQTTRVQQENKRAEAFSQEQIGRWNAETHSALKDEFLAIMSHELRHPLNLIQINVQLLSRLPAVQESPVGTKAAAAIRSSVISQAKIIEDLLDLSRLNTGKLALSMGQVNLTTLVSSIVESFQTNAAAEGLNVRFEGIPEPLIVMADQVRVEQVILNLLNNAEKFTQPGGSILVRLGLEGQDTRLDVIDNGVGIMPGQLAGIFDMFSQAGAITNRSKKGLGIGLALVRQIVELHHGRVEAFSEGMGTGARFSVWLPLAENVKKVQAGTAPDLAQKINGLRILIVDDSEDMNFSLKALLEIDGATVFVAQNAGEGLAILQQEKVDLLISDISMPKVNGYEFIQQVRQHNINIPAIAASGLCREQDIARSLESGFSAHIVKPMSFEQLTDIITELFRSDVERRSKQPDV
jgi:two-component system CheB/CheR fusion protein